MCKHGLFKCKGTFLNGSIYLDIFFIDLFGTSIKKQEAVLCNFLLWNVFLFGTADIPHSCSSFSRYLYARVH